MIEDEWIVKCIEKSEYFFTYHGDKERQNDNLLIAEVKDALLNVIIIKQYEDTGRGESCLVAGFTSQGKPVHIVCGELDNKLSIITVYIPKPPKFVNPYQRG